MWTILESSADKAAHLPEFDEPLLLGEELPAPTPWLKMLFYVAGSVVLTLSLLAQTLYFYPDYYLRHAQWRPLIAQACTYLGCEVLPEKNVEALRSVFLAVDPHPDYQDMLLVTFRAQNTAWYPLAFPSADLVFADLSNKPVAARRFYPGHYLAAPLLSEQFIAPGAEISGTIALRNPGSEAVNYTLEFVYENN